MTSSVERTLGRDGLTVSSLGLGCMGMSQSYGPADRDESIATIHRALDLGITFLDTSDVYGRGTTRSWSARPSPAAATRWLATKFSLSHNPDGRRIDGRPENVRVLRGGQPAPPQGRRDRPLPAPGRPRRCRSRTPSARWPTGGAGQGPPSRAVGGQRGIVAAGRRGPPRRALQSEWSLWTRDLEARVVAAGSTGRDRAVQPARPRPSPGDHQRRLRRGRLPPQQAPLPGRGVAANLRLVEAAASSRRRRRA